MRLLEFDRNKLASCVSTVMSIRSAFNVHVKNQIDRLTFQECWQNLCIINVSFEWIVLMHSTETIHRSVRSFVDVFSVKWSRSCDLISRENINVEMMNAIMLHFECTLTNAWRRNRKREACVWLIVKKILYYSM